MELEEVSCEDQARAAALEWHRLKAANDTPETLRAFAAGCQHQQAERGADSVLRSSDRAFLSRCPPSDGRLPGAFDMLRAACPVVHHLTRRLAEAQTRAGAVPLHRAAALGDTELVRRELDALGSCSVDDLRNASGETLLHTAVLFGRVGVAQALLMLGASPLTPLHPRSGGDESTLLSVAPRSDNFRAGHLLAGGDATPLHYACVVGDLELLELLLANAGDHHNNSVRPGGLLLWAIAGGHAHMVAFLPTGAPPPLSETDCDDEDGNNAFAIAALLLARDPPRLQGVLRALAGTSDADINHRNARGLSALDVAPTPAAREALSRLGARSARGVPVSRALAFDRDAFLRDVRLSSTPGRPRAMFRREV